MKFFHLQETNETEGNHVKWNRLRKVSIRCQKHSTPRPTFSGPALGHIGLGPQRPSLKLAQILCPLTFLRHWGATLRGRLPTKWKDGCEEHSDCSWRTCSNATNIHPPCLNSLAAPIGQLGLGPSQLCSPHHSIHPHWFFQSWLSVDSLRRLAMGSWSNLSPA